MLKNLLYTAFRTLCPKIFTKSTNKIQQEISSSQTSGTYVAPNNGVVKLVGFSSLGEVNNITSGEAISVNTPGDNPYKAVSIFARKGDSILWKLSNHSGNNSYLYFFYSDFEAP